MRAQENVSTGRASASWAGQWHFVCPHDIKTRFMVAPAREIGDIAPIFLRSRALKASFDPNSTELGPKDEL